MLIKLFSALLLSFAVVSAKEKHSNLRNGATQQRDLTYYHEPPKQTSSSCSPYQVYDSYLGICVNAPAPEVASPPPPVTGPAPKPLALPTSDVSSDLDAALAGLCPNFQCPANSFSIAKDGCVNSFAECKCKDGFEKKNGACVKKCPNFQCPANSFSIAKDGCVDSFAECECKAGFEPKNGACVKQCPNFQCPANSSPKSGVDCISSASDCQCNAGYEAENGQCIKKDVEIIMCYIRNLDTQHEEVITGSFSYTPGSHGRYSIRCDTTEMYDHSKWHFNGETSDDWSGPFWMKNNDGDRIFDADYLATCGYKTISFGAYAWSSDEPLATKKLELEALCN